MILYIDTHFFYEFLKVMFYLFIFSILFIQIYVFSLYEHRLFACIVYAFLVQH